MLKEPKLSVFYSPPKHDLKLNYDAEQAALKDEEEEEVVWPDTEQLLGDDMDYQKLITDIMDIIDQVMDEVTDYSRVREHCVPCHHKMMKCLVCLSFKSDMSLNNTDDYIHL